MIPQPQYRESLRPQEGVTTYAKRIFRILPGIRRRFAPAMQPGGMN
jgi:hypothetical protein